jgi:hypothetical protein
LTRSRAQNKNLQVQQTLIDWRRSQIIQLIHKGKTLNEIAEILQLDRSTISRDYQCIKDNAADVMSKYSVETIPMEVMKFLARLDAVSDEAWRMVEWADKEGDNRAKLQALYLAQDTALQIVDVITNNKMLIDEAFKNPIQNQI